LNGIILKIKESQNNFKSIGSVMRTLGVLFKGFEKEGLILMEMKFMV
jgi:hypothetical protein